MNPLDLMVDSFASLNASDIRQLETDFGSAFPNSYREFLLQHNGGRFVDRVEVATASATSETPAVWCFYSIGAGDDRFDIRKLGRQSKFPQGCFAFARGSECEYLLDTAPGPNFGRVVHFDRWKANDPPSGDDPLNGQSVIASSFDEFVKSLHLIPEEPDDFDDFEKLPAFEAVRAGDLAELQKLVESGLDINVRDENFRPLLTVATERPAIVKYLLDAGANIHAADRDGREALWFAYEVFDSSKLLLEHGANPNCRSLRTGETPILMAYNLRILKALIEHGADMYAHSKSGETVFSIWNRASTGNRKLGFQILIDAGYEMQPEIEKLISALRQYVPPGFRPIPKAKMKEAVHKIVDAGNLLLDTCRSLIALGPVAKQASKPLEAVLKNIPHDQPFFETDRKLVKETLDSIQGNVRD